MPHQFRARQNGAFMGYRNGETPGDLDKAHRGTRGAGSQ